MLSKTLIVLAVVLDTTITGTMLKTPVSQNGTMSELTAGHAFGVDLTELTSSTVAKCLARTYDAAFFSIHRFGMADRFGIQNALKFAACKFLTKFY